ncbi:MAG: glycosyltransferase [Prevotella sp.]|nr:glycosyltransferase [Prevotella sp.]
MKYSIIVPVFNRPDEVDELLESLCQQEVKDFEVIIVEDGSSIPCKDVCDKYAGILDLHYYFKENSGPGQSRNYGAERANGDWLIVLDSDVVLPEGYLRAVDERLKMKNERYDYTCGNEPDSKTDHIYHLSSFISSIDAWGGPDASHPSFTPVQKAISYSMTSFFTTGGIRGGKGKKLDKFFPRSYNMGIRREVYQELGGFSKMRFGEDIDFSYRIVEAGYKTALIPEAWVWHKRRTDFRKFFRQVSNSGRARINLEKRHPGTMKLVHLLPTVFTLGVIGLLLCTTILLFLSPCLSLLALSPIILYSLIICIDSSILNKSLWVGLLSIPAAFVQLMGYGLGFIEQWWKRCILKQPETLPADLSEAERQALEKKFYK